MGHEQFTAAPSNKEEYLRLCGVIAPLMPGKMKTSAGWVRPIFAYALMNALNGIIKHRHEDVSWKFENDVLTQSTSWTLVDLKQRITTARKWPGSEAQLKTAIENFAVAGFLSFNSTSKKYSIQLKLLEWLFSHASSLYLALFNEQPPQSWKKEEKGSWLDFNEIFFKYFYEAIGDNWRDFRNAANKEVASHVPKSKNKKNNDYTTDYIGERPEYWVVIFTVGFLEPVNQWSIPDRARSLKINTYANNATDVANAVEQLRDYGVITIDGAENVCIAPKFSSRMEHVISAVEVNMPKLRTDCDAWKAKLQK